MQTIAVYGSLKRGKFNHPILADNATFLGETTLTGTLYRVSSYPALLDEGSNKYVAEVYNVPDDIADSIHRMEIGAGYKMVEEDTEYGEAIVYYADGYLAERCRDTLEAIPTY